jgi:hypothetical protein
MAVQTRGYTVIGIDLSADQRGVVQQIESS